jgi:hypothetical protein
MPILECRFTATDVSKASARFTGGSGHSPQLLAVHLFFGVVPRLEGPLVSFSSNEPSGIIGAHLTIQQSQRRRSNPARVSLIYPQFWAPRAICRGRGPVCLPEPARRSILDVGPFYLYGKTDLGNLLPRNVRMWAYDRAGPDGVNLAPNSSATQQVATRFRMIIRKLPPGLRRSAPGCSNRA